jgi:hypothetical protein
MFKHLTLRLDGGREEIGRVAKIYFFWKQMHLQETIACDL